MTTKDENDHLLDGTLPEDPFADAAPVQEATTSPLKAGVNAETVSPHAPGTAPVTEKASSSGTDSTAPHEPPVKKASAPPEEPWPALLTPDAFHGLAGQFVHAVEPHSEADPVALLLQFLVVIACIVDRKSWFQVEGSNQYLNEYLVLVGRTSKARKGTALTRVLQMLKDVSPGWVRAEGLSSGEGVIWKVRDEISKKEKTKDEHGVEIGVKIIVSDPGVEDKRLLVKEGEFAAVVKVMSREGNTVSPVLRNAWDHGDIESMVKNSPAKATGAHINIIGHITIEELLRYFDDTEMANGFGNRFLWALVRRSKILPRGGNLDEKVLENLVSKIKEVITFAETAGLLQFEKEAGELWDHEYPVLSEGRPGLLGAMTNRAEAHVMRLACLYAILDKKKEILVSHLKAALAIWRYCEESVQIIFGKRTGNPVADQIYFALRKAPKGLNRTEIRKISSGHEKEPVVQRALDLLLKRGLATMESKETGGRPEERWSTVS